MHHPLRKTAVALLAALTPVALAAVVVGPAHAVPPKARAGSVDTTNRQQVADSYFDDFVPLADVPPRWSGSTRTCSPGAPSAEFTAGALDGINYVRALAGLDPVSFSPTWSTGAQQAALMMTANAILSHYPDPSWKCYTADGAEAAGRSNLAIWWGRAEQTAQDVAAMYMTDRGDSNLAAGHRRWILEPTTAVMGFGATDSANALTVFGPDENPAASKPPWLPWPTAGYFPDAMEPEGRWSLSASRAVDFDRATVAMTGPAGDVPVTVHEPEYGYGPDTLVWDVDGELRRPASTGQDEAYTVTVAGMRKPNGTAISPYTYTVTLIHPQRPFTLVTPPTVADPGPYRPGDLIELEDAVWLPAADGDRDTWFRDGVRVARSGDSYRVRKPDVGHHLTAEVTPWANPAGDYYGGTPYVLDLGTVVPTPALRFTTKPRLAGTPAVGKVLRVNPGPIAPAAAEARFGYRWLVDGYFYGGDRRTYRVPGFAAGQVVSVEVHAFASGYRDAARSTKRVRVRR